MNEHAELHSNTLEPEVLLPAWLDAHAVADADMAEAYEALGAQSRSELKLTIARLHTFWGEKLGTQTHIRRFPQGFSAQVEEAPALYALVLCATNYAHPACLLAAIMPAVFAGVRHIVPCFIATDTGVGVTAGSVNGSAVAELPAVGLLAAMELAGIERSFVLTEQEAARLLAEMHQNAGNVGRVVVLGEVAHDVLLQALRLGVLCHAYVQEPQNFAAVADEDFSPGSPLPTPSPRIALALDAAHAGMWLWPDLGPDWFRSQRVRITQ